MVPGSIPGGRTFGPAFGPEPTWAQAVVLDVFSYRKFGSGFLYFMIFVDVDYFLCFLQLCVLVFFWRVGVSVVFCFLCFFVFCIGKGREKEVLILCFWGLW